MLAENSIRWASRARDGPGASRQDRRRSWHRGPGFSGGQTFRPAHAEDTAWGGYVGYFADPDGHVWEVARNPGFPFADDGSVLVPD